MGTGLLSKEALSDLLDLSTNLGCPKKEHSLPSRSPTDWWLLLPNPCSFLFILFNIIQIRLNIAVTNR